MHPLMVRCGHVIIVRRNKAHTIPGGNCPNMYMSWAYMHLSPYTKRKICYTPYISNTMETEQSPGMEFFANKELSQVSMQVKRSYF